MESNSVPGSSRRLLQGIVALFALAALTVLSIQLINPPSPRADAPGGEFSSGRAFAHVETIGSKVHVAGSQPAAEVRDYIQRTVSALGLETSVQTAVGAEDALGGSFAMANVNNVVARLPGTASTGTIFLVAHYDSVQVSYGANDDGAGTATLLETARALTTLPKLRNDVVFVFTDAEEACLCGAEAFKSLHPLAANGGVVLNFEARGVNGPVIMFETTQGNADLVALYGDNVPYPVGTSFAVEVYRILPNDTDFSPFRDSGRFTGLNSAYIDGSPAYHTPQDRPEYMDQGTLQHHGANALALVRALGDADVAAAARPSAYDSTYFPAFGQLVRYPGWLVWPFAGLALLAVIGLAIVARRRSVTTWPRLVAGFGLGVIPLVAGLVLAQVLWALLVAVRPEYGAMADPWQPVWYRAGVVALVVAAVLTWYGLLRRRFGAWTLATGALGWLAVLGLVLAYATPGGSYLASLPTLAAAIGGIVACRPANRPCEPDDPRPSGTVALSVRREWLSLLAVTLGGAVAVLILAPTVLLFFPALGLELGAAAALFATMLFLALLPVLDWLYPTAATQAAAEPADAEGANAAAGVETDGDLPAPARPRRIRSALPALVAGGLAVAFVGTGLVVDRFDAAHPAPEQMMYALDADTGQARWVSGDASPGAWASQLVTGREDLAEAFPIIGDGVATGPAQAANLPAPAVTVDAQPAAGGQRTVTVTITPQRPVRLVYFEVRGVTVHSAVVQGRTVPAEALEGDFSVLFHAPGAGITVTMVLDAGAATLRVMDGSDGLEGLPGFIPRPSAVGVEGSHDSEMVVVAKTYPL